MTAQADHRDGAKALRRVIAQGGLSEALRVHAQSLLNDIERPVRLATFGLPGSGKSQIMNFLAGTDVIPTGARLPTLQICYGDDAMARCTLPDGSTRTLPMTDIDAITTLGPIFVDATLPLPALKTISILEVRAGADIEEQRRAMAWAAKRSDIALWCSKGTFGQDEQAIWAHMPAALLDRAICLMTHADSDIVEEAHPDRLDQALSTAQNHFGNVLPIGIQAAISARNPDGSVDKELLRSSGGMAVISAILRAVETGRQNARDQADIFLRQIEVAPQRAVEPPVQKKPATETSEPETPEPKTSEPVVEVAEKILQTGLGPASRKACAQAVAQLGTEGTLIADALETVGLQDAEIVEICVDSMVWLADFLAESGNDGDQAMSQLRETAMDAADLVQLIQLETGETVANDSVSVMVQVKQELQQMLAA